MHAIPLLLAALIGWDGPAWGEDAGDEAGSVFRPVHEPDLVFDSPSPRLSDEPPLAAPAPEPLAVPGETEALRAGREGLVLPPAPTTLEPSGSVSAAPPAARPFGFRMSRDGMTWLPGDGDRLGILSLGDDPGTLTFTEPQQLTGTLGFGVHFLDGPHRTDLPSKLFDFGFGVGWRDEINSSWAYEMVVAPGVYADFEGSAREGVRILGQGIVWYRPSAETLWGVGVVSLDRETLAVLPVIGVVHQPDDRTRLELLFPRPRLARRIGPSGEFEPWIYLAGEYGGGSWAIERFSDEDDVLTINDLRLIVGAEWLKPADDLSSYLEVGYVFAREVRYASGRGDYDPADTLMLRLGTGF